MHEMSIVTDIIKAVAKKAEELDATQVKTIVLQVGEVRDIHEDLLQRYFDYFSKGTVAEGVEVTMVVVPLRYACQQCSRVYGFDLYAGEIKCLDEEQLAKLQEESLAPDRPSAKERTSPHCPFHPHAPVDIVSGSELTIIEMGVI
ncbi:MAG: hydrogenase maturation nickel metallochaperone HypA [Eggerthellaceae bacterium]